MVSTKPVKKRENQERKKYQDFRCSHLEQLPSGTATAIIPTLQDHYLCQYIVNLLKSLLGNQGKKLN